MNNRISTYYIVNIAPCNAGSADVEMYASRLESLGLRRAAHIEVANLIIVNSCVYIEEKERETENHIRKMALIKTKRKDIKIALVGCIVGYRGMSELRKRFSYVDVFMPPSDIGSLINFLLENCTLENKPSQGRQGQEFFCQDMIQKEEYNWSEYNPHNFFPIPIVYGCSQYCSYCIVPYCRGPARSRSKAKIMQEVYKLAEKGVCKVLLSGSNVDLYGTDIKDNVGLADLLTEVAEISGIYQIRFAESHPSYITDKLLNTVANTDKIRPVFLLGLQSGNDEILTMMKRGYTSYEYRKVIERIWKKIPNAFIITHVIVGFPTESHEQFMDTYNLLKDLRPNKIITHMYSERPGTLASKEMTNDVPFAEKKLRMQMIEQLFREYIDPKNRLAKRVKFGLRFFRKVFYFGFRRLIK